MFKKLVRESPFLREFKRKEIFLKRRYSYKAPLKDVNFLFQNVFDFPAHYKSLPNGQNATKDTVDMVLSEMAKFSENDLAPLMETADVEGCKLKDVNQVITPTGFKEAYKKYFEGGWQGLCFPEEYGGQGLPSSLAVIISEMIASANFTWGMFPGLSKGCINTILEHGTSDLKNKYLNFLISGEFSGTMCLTEPQCGSDLSQVNTKAIPNTDGTYSISGTKIFISCGEHDLTENIIHCVLARLPDSPKGTKGISLFLVPKRLVTDDGKLDKHNNVNISRIESKMGCHGSPTCEIIFENSKGFLIGIPNRGLNHMFTFINTSRLGTAIQGVSTAELAFQNSLIYARDRCSMRSLSGTKFPENPADPLIVHPDIRRMLLTIKSFSEGGRAMIYQCALLSDKEQAAKQNEDDKQKNKLEDQLGFLTPILKGFLTECGVEAANLGIQIWGGHGYIRKNLMEQIARDVRISTLWEGTTGIQALDLLGRKLMLQKMRPLFSYSKEIIKYCYEVARGPNRSEMLKYIKPLFKNVVQWNLLTMKIALKAKKDPEMIGSAAVDYLMYSGYISMAYSWLQIVNAAVKESKENPSFDDSFLKSKILTADFYFERILPRTKTLKYTMTRSTKTVMEMTDEQFGLH